MHIFMSCGWVCSCVYCTYQEFDSTLFEISNSSEEEPHKNLWMCGASLAIMVINKFEWCRDVMDKICIYIHYHKWNFELVNWHHCLAILNVGMSNNRKKFYDENGYDMIPTFMIVVMNIHNAKSISIRKRMESRRASLFGSLSKSNLFT